MNESLNMNWLNDFECLDDSKMTQVESMPCIQYVILYINNNNELEKDIVCDSVSVDSDIITYKSMNDIVKKHSKYGYDFHDMMLYNVDIDPRYIQTWSSFPTDASASFTPLSPPVQLQGIKDCFLGKSDIFIKPTAKIFHCINTLFITFVSRKSCFVLLRPGACSRTGPNKTKKVRFHETIKDISSCRNASNKTHKAFASSSEAASRKSTVSSASGACSRTGPH